MPTVVKGTSRAWIRPGGLDNKRYGYELVVPTQVAVNDHLSSIRGRAPRGRRAPVSPLSIKKRSEDRNRAGDQTSQAAPSPRLCLTRLISSPFRESEGDLGMWSWCPRCLLARKARAWREGCGSWFGYCAVEIAPAAFRSTRLCQKECLFGNFSLFVFFCLFVPPSAYGNWCCKKDWKFINSFI